MTQVASKPAAWRLRIVNTVKPRAMSFCLTDDYHGERRVLTMSICHA
jgi:hypothetical protein